MNNLNRALQNNRVFFYVKIQYKEEKHMAEPNESAMPVGMGRPEQPMPEPKEPPIDVPTPEATNNGAVTPSEKRAVEKESEKQDIKQDKAAQETPVARQTSTPEKEAAAEQSPEKNTVRRGRPPKAEKIEKESKKKD